MSEYHFTGSLWHKMFDGRGHGDKGISSLLPERSTKLFVIKLPIELNLFREGNTFVNHEGYLIDLNFVEMEYLHMHRYIQTSRLLKS